MTLVTLSVAACSSATLDLEVALDAADGETVAVLGPNGAGKTTLLRALAGLRAARPRVASCIDGVVLDEPAHGHVRRPRAAQRRRRVPGLPAVPAPHRARERRVRAAQPRHGRAEARAARADEWLARVGLADRARREAAASSRAVSSSGSRSRARS